MLKEDCLAKMRDRQKGVQTQAELEQRRGDVIAVGGSRSYQEVRTTRV